MYKKIIPVRIYENIVNQMLDLIKKRDLKAGDKLPPERELSELFSISRGSLREAFRVLESKGLIKSLQGGGRYIKEVDKNAFIDTKNIVINIEKSSLQELLEARETFEIKTASLAAIRATEEDIKMIEKNLDDMESNNYSSEKSINQLDNEFHLCVAKASHNFVFVNIVRLHLDLLKEISYKTWHIAHRRKEQKEEHNIIFEAIKNRNSGAAAIAMNKHLKNIERALKEYNLVR